MAKRKTQKAKKHGDIFIELGVINHAPTVILALPLGFSSFLFSPSSFLHHFPAPRTRTPTP